MKPCVDCHATSATALADGVPRGDGKCSLCDGSGRWSPLIVSKLLESDEEDDPCVRCGGSGVCPTCGGSGLVPAETHRNDSAATHDI